MSKLSILLIIIGVPIIFLTSCSSIESLGQEESLTIATWKVRDYPETQVADRDWFHNKLIEINPDILCVQEIANVNRVDTFIANENQFRTVAFLDSSDGQDNAIFAAPIIEMNDIPDPTGFQHPAQAAYVACRGFDAVIVTVHLSWTNIALREKEKLLFKDVVSQMLMIDPDVIIAGDFNIQGSDLKELAESIGMTIMIPDVQDGVGTTYAGNRYDHFLISQDLANEEAIGCNIHTFTGPDLISAKRVSDHLPVIAYFRTDLRFTDRK